MPRRGIATIVIVAWRSSKGPAKGQDNAGEAAGRGEEGGGGGLRGIHAASGAAAAHKIANQAVISHLGHPRAANATHARSRTLPRWPWRRRSCCAPPSEPPGPRRRSLQGCAQRGAWPRKPRSGRGPCGAAPAARRGRFSATARKRVGPSARRRRLRRSTSRGCSRQGGCPQGGGLGHAPASEEREFMSEWRVPGVLMAHVQR